MHRLPYFQYPKTVSFLWLALLQFSTLTKAIPLENDTQGFPNIDPPKSHCNINGSLSATDSAVFTSDFVNNQSVPLAWVLGVAAHQYDRDTIGVSRTFYFGPQLNEFANTSVTVQGCALFFPSASAHYNNTSSRNQNPTDEKLPAKCLADMQELVQRAARNESAQFERDPTGTCDLIAGKIVTTDLQSCFGYNVQNVHPRPLSAFETSSSITKRDLFCQPSTTPKYDLTLIEDNSVGGSKGEFGLASMINYSTPIITVIYPSPMPSNGSLFDPELHYTVLEPEPVDYQPLLDLLQTSLAPGLGISSMVFIAMMVHMAFMLL